MIDNIELHQKLPHGWICTTIDEITEAIQKVKPEEEFPEKTFAYLDISSIDNKTQRIINPKTYIGKDAPSRARQLVNANDVLFSTVRTYLKNIAFVPEVFDKQIASTGFSILRAKKGIVPKFLFYYTLTSSFLSRLSELQRGTSYPAVRDQDVRDQFIPLPPNPEQQRIIAKIEELFTNLDAGVDALQRAKTLLKRYRQSVLKAAVTGELTKEWREAHKNEIESANALLERYGKKPSKSSDLPELPEGWCWTSISQVVSDELYSFTDGPFGSNLKTEHYAVSGPRVIRLQNIGNGNFNNDLAHISPDHFETLRKHEIFAGDLVIAALGDSLPRACIIPEYVGLAIVKADCMRFKPHSQLAEPKYLNFALNSDVVKKLAAKIIHGIGRPRLNQKEVKSLPIPLPSLFEQNQIVMEGERLLSIEQELELNIDNGLMRISRLRQSILSYAFQGKLVPQDPNDKPASVLLERIRSTNNKEPLQTKMDL